MAASRCPDCSKFVSLEMGDPEVNTIDIQDGVITAQVRIVRNCAECGTEMKEANFDPEVDLHDAMDAEELSKHFDEDGHELDGHELSVNEGDCEGTEEGGSRYAKSFFGFNLSFEVMCSCSTEAIYNGDLNDKIQASAMDELN